MLAREDMLESKLQTVLNSKNWGGECAEGPLWRTSSQRGRLLWSTPSSV